MSPEEDRTRDTVDSEPKHYQLSYSGPQTINDSPTAVNKQSLSLPQLWTVSLGESLTVHSCGIVSDCSQLWERHWLFTCVGESLTVHSCGRDIDCSQLWESHWLFTAVGESLTVHSCGRVIDCSQLWESHWLFTAVGESLTVHSCGVILWCTDPLNLWMFVHSYGCTHILTHWLIACLSTAAVGSIHTLIHSLTKCSFTPVLGFLSLFSINLSYLCLQLWWVFSACWCLRPKWKQSIPSHWPGGHDRWRVQRGTGRTAPGRHWLLPPWVWPGGLPARRNCHRQLTGRGLWRGCAKILPVLVSAQDGVSQSKV